MKQFLLFFCLLHSFSLLFAQYDDDFCPCQLEGLVSYNVYESDLQAVADYTTQYHTVEDVEVQRVEISFESTHSLFAAISTKDTEEDQFAEEDFEEDVANAPVEEEQAEADENIKAAEQDLAFGQEALDQENQRAGSGLSPRQRSGEGRIKKKSKHGPRVRLKKAKFRKYRGKCPSF